METAKTAASNQRALWTPFSIGLRELTASNCYEQPQFRVARCPGYYAKTGET